MTSVQSKLLLQKAVAQQRVGNLEEAAALCSRAAALSPADPLCGLAHAAALAELGRFAEAESKLAALAKRHPHRPEILDYWGVVLQRLGRMADAIRATRQAVAAAPGFVQGWCNLGLALLNTEYPSEALICFDRVIGLDRGSARGHHGRAMALQHLHRIPEAVEAYGRAIALDPQNFETRSYRLMALHYLSGISREQLWQEHQEYANALATARAGAPADSKAVSPVGAAGREERGALPPVAARAAAPAALAASPGAASGVRRLRVAFLSPDLRGHSIAFFLEPLLAHLDPAQFEVVLYHDHYIEDAMSARLKARAALWRNFIGIPAAAVAARIRADQPDILVDLCGHTGLNRLPLLAARVAPVQVTYLGYPDTTGLPTMDFRFVDEVTDPIGPADSLHSERLVRFAPTAWSYAPPAEAPVPAQSPPVGNRPVIFGCFNIVAKVSDETLRGWRAVLCAVPHSRLLLKAGALERPEVAAWVRGRMQSAGIDPARVDLAGKTPQVSNHLACYHRVDVALDTYPYHGTTTTCEALWMGVPVISLQGDRHCSRVGGSLLKAVGRSEWAVDSWENYVAAAASTAARPVDRAALRAQMAASVLMDHAGQAARFGAALRQCSTLKCSTVELTPSPASRLRRQPPAASMPEGAHDPAPADECLHP